MAVDVHDEGPHDGLGRAHWTHLGDEAAQNTTIGVEADEVELHALDRDAGLVLDHEVQATAVVGAFDAVELDQHVFVGREGAEREEQLQDDKRTQHATHGCAAANLHRETPPTNAMAAECPQRPPSLPPMLDLHCYASAAAGPMLA